MTPTLCKICNTRHWSAVCTAPDSTGRFKPVPVVAAPKPPKVAAPARAVPKSTAPSAFNRNAYQRQYMADQKFAKAEGLTVAQWRKKNEASSTSACTPSRP